MALAYTSDCTFYSDYTFDPSVCWAITRTSGQPVYTQGVVLATDPTATTKQAFGEFTGSFWSYSRWSFTTESGLFEGATESVYEIIEVPSSLEKCLPGPISCLYRYQDTGCPNGHTTIGSSTIVGGISTIYCCPYAENLADKLSTEGYHGTLQRISDNGYEVAYSGPLLACSYQGGPLTSGKFPTMSPQESTMSDGRFYSSQEYNVLGLKPIEVVMLATSSSSSSTTASPASTPVLPPATSSPPPAQFSNKSKIGIGIGIGAGLGGLLLIALIGVFVFLRRARKRKNKTTRDYIGKPELGGEPVAKYKTELPDRPVHELEGSANPVEIERSPQVYEMEDIILPVEADGSSNVLNAEARYRTKDADGG